MFFRKTKINKNKGLPRGTKWSGGFTLIEMMVVMVISTIIITALVVQQSRWNDRITVSTQAYELSLMIRQAQIWSLGVREDTGGSGDKFDVGYGIFVNAAAPTQYVFFADRDKDLRYDHPGEMIETKLFTRGVTINRICSIGAGGFFPLIRPGDQYCSNNGWHIGFIHKFHGSFKRPDTATKMKFYNIGITETTNFLEPIVQIYLQSPGGRQSVVILDSTGQVSVDDI